MNFKRFDKDYEIYEDGTILYAGNPVKARAHKRRTFQARCKLSSGDEIYFEVGRLTYIAFNTKEDDIVKAYREFDKKTFIIHLDGNIENNNLNNLAPKKVGKKK